MKAPRVLLIAFTLVAGTNGAGRTATDPAPPNIVTRAEWGARAPKQPPERLSENPAPFVIVHHSASDGCTSRAICQARVRSFQNYHMDAKGWADVGYNFLVGEDGNVYEGRGWDVRGAHSVPYNAKSIGICVIGDFSNREPLAAAVRAVKELTALGVSSGKIDPSYALYAHRQTSATVCPGDKLYQLVKTWPHWRTK